MAALDIPLENTTLIIKPKGFNDWLYDDKPNGSNLS